MSKRKLRSSEKRGTRDFANGAAELLRFCEAAKSAGRAILRMARRNCYGFAKQRKARDARFCEWRGGTVTVLRSSEKRGMRDFANGAAKLLQV